MAATWGKDDAKVQVEVAHIYYDHVQEKQTSEERKNAAIIRAILDQIVQKVAIG